MKDLKAIKFLEARMGGPAYGRVARVAEALGISRGCLAMWKTRGAIPVLMRLRVREVLNLHGANLPIEWAISPRAFNDGGGNGGKGKGRTAAKVKRHRSQQPRNRRTTHRGHPAAPV